MAGRLALFDPFAGISGDMILGAWIDLGLDRDWLLEVADRLELRVTEIEVRRVDRAGLSAPHVTPRFPESSGDGTGHGRSYAAIREQIEGSSLPEEVRKRALGAFERLARAEARVHGVEPEEVHLHEVGAADAILDVCAAADGFARLGIEEARTFPVAVGRGSVSIRHGEYPVPAPATANLLEGTEIRASGYEGECVTPTGAALLQEFTRGRHASGDLTLDRVGYGAGTRNPEERPNCLRVWLGRPGRGGHGAVSVLQADIDDMQPEYVPDLVETCLEAGALDAVIRPVQMKKGRPGWRVEALVGAADQAPVEAALFRHSTTLGVRSWPVSRRTLDRSTEERTWRGHALRVKVTEVPTAGGGFRRRGKAEHDDVVAAAAAEEMEPSTVLRELRRTWPDLA